MNIDRNKVIEVIESKGSLADEDLSFLDLSQINFKGIDLSGVTFTGAKLTGCDFSGCNLTGAFMAENYAQKSIFKKAIMDDVFFQRGIIDGANFRDASMVDSSIFLMEGKGVVFVNANMNGTKILKSILPESSFENVDLGNSSLKGSDVQHCNFNSAKLDNCDMRQTLTQGATFEGASTEGVLFYGKKPWGEAADTRDWTQEFVSFNDD